MNIRKDINSLSEAELLAFRQALSALQNEASGENYQYLAGLHGLPNPSNCPHHLPEFLPWHRLYLNHFERSLQRHNPSITLPYWNWASDKSITEGIPEILKSTTFINSQGVEESNPLFQAAVEFENRTTSRNPSSSSDLQFLANQVDVAKEEKQFFSPQSDSDFTSALEMPHDWLHGWVGNDMGIIAYSAFDPIFWLHHCNVDRFWAEWQVANPNVVISEELLAVTLPVYSQRIGDTLDFKSLGVTYDTLQAPLEPGLFSPLTEEARLESALPIRQKRVLLLVGGLQMRQSTFELRFFVNKEGEFEPATDAEGFAGSIFILGMASARNPRGFMGEFKRVVDLTQALNSLGDSQVESLSVRGFDQDGNLVSVEKIAPQLRFKVKN
jgi:tyrosinase